MKIKSLNFINLGRMRHWHFDRMRRDKTIKLESASHISIHCHMNIQKQCKIGKGGYSEKEKTELRPDVPRKDEVSAIAMYTEKTNREEPNR